MPSAGIGPRNGSHSAGMNECLRQPDIDSQRPVRRVDPNEPRFGRYRRARAGSRQSAGASSIHCAPACLAADPDQDLRGVRRLPEAGVPLSADRPERSDDHHRQLTTALLGAVGCSPVSVAYLSSPEW